MLKNVEDVKQAENFGLWSVVCLLLRLKSPQNRLCSQHMFAVFTPSFHVPGCQIHSISFPKRLYPTSRHKPVRLAYACRVCRSCYFVDTPFAGFQLMVSGPHTELMCVSITSI